MNEKMKLFMKFSSFNDLHCKKNGMPIAGHPIVKLKR
jgi:hypothetical protein